MSMIMVDVDKETQAIATNPTLDSLTFEMGKHTVKMEMIHSFWHQKKYDRFPPKDDYVFRFSLDGQDVMEYGERAFVWLSPFGDNRPYISRPKWLPDDVHLKTANNAFTKAMRTMMPLPAQSVSGKV
jgi:hypothetical protein